MAYYWASEYLKDPETAPARPFWLPIPDPPRAQTPEGGAGESQAGGSDPPAGEDQPPITCDESTATEDDDDEDDDDDDEG